MTIILTLFLVPSTAVLLLAARDARRAAIGRGY